MCWFLSFSLIISGLVWNCHVLFEMTPLPALMCFPPVWSPAQPWFTRDSPPSHCPFAFSLCVSFSPCLFVSAPCLLRSRHFSSCNPCGHDLVTSAKEVMFPLRFACLSVCLLLSRITQKVQNWFPLKCFWGVGHDKRKNTSNFALELYSFTWRDRILPCGRFGLYKYPSIF